MIVTAVTLLDKRKSKVFLSEGFAFVLYRSEVEKFHIEEGKELPESDYRKIVEEILMERARERALFLLQFQGRTKSQMEGRLTEDGYPKEVIERIMAFLSEYRFVDDGVYTENFISVNQKKKSRRQMTYELRQKGVDKEEIDRIFEKIPVDEVESAKNILRKRLKGKSLDSYEEKCRQSAYLGRKGYSMDTIRKALEEIKEE